MRPRQSDIARLARVSQTTVSLTLNGKTAEYGINRATEERIMSAARELGYVPNVTARALRGGRNCLLGVHAYESLFPTSRESYYEEILVGIEQGAIRTGQDLVLFTSVHSGQGRASIFDGGRNRLKIADGTLIIGFDQHDDELVRLAEEGFPFVFIGRREKPAALGPYVTADYVGAVRSVAAQVRALGHRRVAYLGLPDYIEPRLERREGFARGVEEHDLTVAGQFFGHLEGPHERWVQEMVESGATALLVEGSAQLETVAQRCDAAGLRIPDDLSVIGLDSIPDPATSSRHWTHVRVPRREMGSRAVELLLEFIDGVHGPAYHERLPCTFEEGETFCPRS